MIFRRIERGEVVKVVLDFGPVGDGEAQRMEQRLDALHCPRDRMQHSDADAASRKRYIEHVAGELLREPRIGEFFATPYQCLFERGLGVVDPRAGGGAVGGGELAQCLQLLGQATGLAEKPGLGIFQSRRVMT